MVEKGIIAMKILVTGHKLAAAGFWSLVPDLFDRQVALMQEVCSFQDKTTLELGALDGRHSAAALRLGARSCLAVEGRRENLGRGSKYTKDVDFLVADVRELPLLDKRWGGPGTTFDIVMAYGILYHVADPVALIRRMRALCCGYLFISTHCVPAARAAIAGGYGGGWWAEIGWTDSALQGRSRQPGYSFWLTEPALLRALRDNGFEVLRTERYDVRGTPATWVAACP